MQKLFFFLFCLLFFFSCKENIDLPADLIYYNGTIWTGNPDQPTAEIIGIAGEKILFVGGTPDRWKGERTKMIDLNGRMVVPGFIDNHTHFLSGGFQLASVDLRSAPSPREFIDRLKNFASNLPEGRWITEGNWDHETWGGELPRRQWIDSITSDNPVFVSRLDGHMALVNTSVLELAGINKDTPDPEGGTIVRDPETGEPTGILKDEAMAMVYQVMPDSDEKELDETFARAKTHAHSLGITQVHDMGSLGGWTDLATYQRAKEKGELDLRIYSFVPISSWERLATYVTENGRGDDWLRWGGLKGFVDGSLGSTTAWFYEPYDDEPETSGLTVTDTSLLEQWMIHADSADLQLAIHAIGDRANDWVLKVFQKAIQHNNREDQRFRIEHAQHLTREAIHKIPGMAIPSMQPYHAIDDGRWAEKRIGPVRIKTTYAFRSLLDKGARLTFGSDWAVAPIDPLQGIYAAVTRRTIDGANPNGWVPEEKIKVEEALRCYTQNNAYAGFQEEKVGRLMPGMLADMVILSENILNIPPGQIPEVNVYQTIIGGKVVFKGE